ncbi:glioma pathogenesis-related protein 1 [Platichthys flesus]|uniref:glioma pathogenesis-related protein 1 n=1 Tax=Platichthys flesus TaxID=8260 RepID=UPI001A84E696|nr:glioma pathogenesis-related protein 1 [Platichthys flesus]
MSSTVGLMWLWVWIILDSGASSVSLPETTDRRFIDECVREHNRARSSVSPPASYMLYMTWDEGLSLIAKEWAEHCVFQHNPKLNNDPSVHPTFSSVGENIWTGSPSLFDVTSAMKNWVDEKEHYDYQGNKCSLDCGHYTQVVWGSSYKVGCAAHLCPGGVAGFDSKEGVVFVCNYATAGNMNSARPYESGGAACSGCSGSCVDRLCRDNRSPVGAPEVAPASASHYPDYLNILIVRPMGLLLTFITAFALHYRYPDVFCYE